MPLFELLLTALDTLLANKVRAVLTTLGVIIGVLSVILLVSLGEGAVSYTHLGHQVGRQLGSSGNAWNSPRSDFLGSGHAKGKLCLLYTSRCV